MRTLIPTSVIYSNNITFRTKHNLYRSLILPILLHECTTWTITNTSIRDKAHRRLLFITYRHRKLNTYVKVIILNHIFKCKPLLNTIKRRKLKYVDHNYPWLR